MLSCSKEKFALEKVENSTNQNVNEILALTSASDSDVFKAVMFLDGPLAYKLSNYKQYNFRNLMSDSKMIDKTVAFQEDLIDLIENNNPGYLKAFRKNISSGDYLIVRNTISKGAEDVLKATSILTGIDESKLTEFSQVELNQINNNVKALTDDVIPNLLKPKKPKKPISHEYLAIDIAVAGYAVVYYVVVVGVAFIISVITTNPNVDNFVEDSFASDVTLNFLSI